MLTKFDVLVCRIHRQSNSWALDFSQTERSLYSGLPSVTILCQTLITNGATGSWSSDDVGAQGLGVYRNVEVSIDGVTVTISPTPNVCKA